MLCRYTIIILYYNIYYDCTIFSKLFTINYECFLIPTILIVFHCIYFNLFSSYYYIVYNINGVSSNVLHSTTQYYHRPTTHMHYAQYAHCATHTVVYDQKHYCARGQSYHCHCHHCRWKIVLPWYKRTKMQYLSILAHHSCSSSARLHRIIIYISIISSGGRLYKII